MILQLQASALELISEPYHLCTNLFPPTNSPKEEKVYIDNKISKKIYRKENENFEFVSMVPVKIGKTKLCQVNYISRN